MLRFRYREDEKRYLTLLGRAYRLIASHLPPNATSQVLRDLGKIQDILWLEGVRQGVAAAGVSNASKEAGEGDLEHLKAFQLHAHVYGSYDTPLRDSEERWSQTLELPNALSHPWLDANPMKFAPDTVESYMSEDAISSPVSAAAAALPVPETCEPDADEDDDEFNMEAVEEMLESREQERPELLDRIRDTLSSMEKPTSWEEMIYKLHVMLHVDAGFLDLQLGTDMGRTVLSQVGIELRPGPFGTSLNDVKMFDSMASALSSTTPQVCPSSEDASCESDPGPRGETA